MRMVLMRKMAASRCSQKNTHKQADGSDAAFNIDEAEVRRKCVVTQVTFRRLSYYVTN
jgi:hypothetical protein